MAWPMARATRWVVGLVLVDMRWISEVGVRWGREGDGEGGGGGGGDGDGDGDGGGGGGLGDVVERARVVGVGW